MALTPAEEAQIRAFLVRNIDMHKRRVVNAGDAVDPQDYITKKQFDGFTATKSGVLVPSHSSTHETVGSDEINVGSLKGLLADPQTPLAHAASHQDDGSDELVLDTLGEPTDNTNLDVSITAHGLFPKLPNNAAVFWNGAGAFSTPSGGSGARTNGFRLTLSSNNPVYYPQPATPSSTDTAAETTTFAAAHLWTDGTIVTVSATVGGLTAGTRYFIHVVSATVVSYHTTLAAALAGTSPVNLTANITSIVIPSGVTNTTVYVTPYKDNTIALYDGATWSSISSAEIPVALGTLTSALGYDFFAYNVSGALTIEVIAWTSNTARTTALVRQDGVWCKTGTLTKRYIGSIYTDSTTTTIMDMGGIATQVGGKAYVYNADNRTPFELAVIDINGGARWSYNTRTVRQANGAAGNKVEFFLGLSEDMLLAEVVASILAGANSNLNGTAGVGFNSTTAFFGKAGDSLASASERSPLIGNFRTIAKVGYNYFAWVECGSGNAGTLNWTPSTLLFRSGYTSSFNEAAGGSAACSALTALIPC